MISVQDALALIRSHRPTPTAETVVIAEAMGRVVTRGVIARMDMPPFAASNMDGYAVSDCQTGDKLEVIGESSAGHPFLGTVTHGEAVRISTGAMMPHGGDRVLIQEHAERDNGFIIVKNAPRAGKHVRATASDFAVGAPLLKPGHRLTPADLTLISAAGHTTIEVQRKPKLAIFSTGDELQPAGKPLSEGEIYAANTIGLKPLLESWGAEVTDYGILRDTAEAVADLLPHLSTYDIIVPIGGASIGDHDHMRPSFRAAGFEMLFETVAVRPGKPSWMGKTANQITFGLPGNPASAFVCAHLFLRPLFGLETQLLQATLSNSLEENGPRETYLRARAFITEGQLHVTAEAQQDSFRLRLQSKANALLRVPALDGPYKQGDRLDIMLIGELAAAE